MFRSPTLRFVLSVLSLVALTSAAAGKNVWDEVPTDALGAVVVRDLSRSDVEAGRLLRALRVPVAQPLALVKGATGINQGLDPHGDLLVAVLPGRGGESRPLLGVWLPVSDYDQLVRSLQGTPRERITAVTIAGEDVLVARHGDWAVVMDSDGRRRLEQVLADEPAAAGQPAVPSAWDDWIESNDASAVLFQAGVGRILSQVLHVGAAGEGARREAAEVPDRQTEEDEPFGIGELGETPNPWQGAGTMVRALLSDLPEVHRRLVEATAVGCGLRLDADGNAVIAVRLAWPSDAASGPALASAEAVPVPYDGGPFVVAGGGEVSPAWMVAAAGPYARLLARDLGIDPREQASAIEAFHQALVHAVEDVTGFAVLSRPGQKSEGVYTNSHLLLRVGSAKTFVERAAAVVARWNGLADHARDEFRLKFQSEPVQIAGRDATQYSVDMVKLVGGGTLPELRRSMEGLFGPGGKLRLQVVPVDDRTVLVAVATDEQASAVVERVARKPSADWAQGELQPTSRLTTAEAPWRLFISPHGYVLRRQREMDAIVGPVLGGPLVRDFPESPPLGVAGGGTNDGIWFELVAPAKTIEAFGQAAQ